MLAGSVLQLLALAIPLSFGVAAAAAGGRGKPLRLAVQVATFAFVLAGVVATGVAVGLAPSDGRSVVDVRLDGVTCVVLGLVTTIALVIARYSRSYLDGDPGRHRYTRWLLATLGAITLLVITDHLAVMAIAWLATSLALHQLLTFYSERRSAIVAAHKEFLVSRIADACLVGALVLIDSSIGSVSLDEIDTWARAHSTLPLSLEIATVLLVLAVALKSAQLPFHGWLMQVMEAPTPISALLHAGVVNIGGFVMIRLAPLMAHAVIAQTLLVAIGMATTVIAALVMTTRVSVKVALAWSTCAQMGFMLVECGLGLWHLALLHLIAHSCYKAHAFLTAGSAVERWSVMTQLPRPAPIALGRAMLAALGLVGVFVAAAWWMGCEPAVIVLAGTLGLSLPTLIFGRGAVRGFVRIVVIAGMYFACHTAAGRVWPGATADGGVFGWGLVVVGFSILFVVQVTCRAHPRGRLARWLYPRLFAGLYLDEWFTRLTFRLCPPRLIARPSSRAALDLASTPEA